MTDRYQIAASGYDFAREKSVAAERRERVARDAYEQSMIATARAHREMWAALRRKIEAYQEDGVSDD